MTPKLLLLAAIAVFACSSGTPAPATVDTRNDTCAWCRMTVSDPRLAGQIVTPGEEARFFDDIECLANYLKNHPADPGAIAFVADRRTAAWIPAASAVFARDPSRRSPMGSGLVAYADAASQALDRQAGAMVVVPARDIFGPALPSRKASR